MEVVGSVTSRKELAVESWRRWVEFVPELRRPWCAVAVGAGVVLGVLFFLAAGHLAARALPFGAVLAQAGFVLWGGLWMAAFWRRRADYRRRYGTLAYRELFFRFLMPAMVSGVAALCFPLLVGGERLLPSVVASGFSVYLLVTALLIELRGREVFWNIDLRGFVYSVFPERGQILTAGIFGRLRHPVYSAFVRFVFGEALIRNNLSAVLCAGVGAIGIWLLAREEERDLERYQAGYVAYRRGVPAFFVARPMRFWRFLIAGRDAG